jgi:hypothetical protein
MLKFDSPYRYITRGFSILSLFTLLTACGVSTNTLGSNVIWVCANWHPALPVYHPEDGGRFSVSLKPGTKVELLGRANLSVATVASRPNLNLGYGAQAQDFVKILLPNGVPAITSAVAIENEHGAGVNTLVAAVVDNRGNDNTDCKLSREDPTYQGVGITLPKSE